MESSWLGCASGSSPTLASRVGPAWATLGLFAPIGIDQQLLRAYGATSAWRRPFPADADRVSVEWFVRPDLSDFFLIAIQKTVACLPRMNVYPTWFPGCLLAGTAQFGTMKIDERSAVLGDREAAWLVRHVKMLTHEGRCKTRSQKGGGRTSIHPIDEVNLGAGLTNEASDSVRYRHKPIIANIMVF